MLFKVAKHKKGEMVEEAKKYIFYLLDQHQEALPTERIVLIFDFSGAGVTNVVIIMFAFVALYPM